MNAFLYGVMLQWKLDLRNKGILLTYYVVPLVFFGFIGTIFTSINPNAKDTIIQTMTIFAVTMGAILGAPTPLVELFGSDIKKAYKVGGIPLWVGVVNNFISAFIHLFIVNLIIFIVAPIIFNAKIPSNLLLYFFTLIVFIKVSLGIGTVLGLVIKSISRLTMISQFIFLPSLMLSGIMFPTDILPSGFGTVGKIFPATWGLTTMTMDTFNIKLFIPFVVILILSIFVSFYRLSKIVLD